MEKLSPREIIDRICKSGVFLAAVILLFLTSVFTSAEFITLASKIAKIDKIIKSFADLLNTFALFFDTTLGLDYFLQIVNNVKVTLLISNGFMPVSYFILSFGALFLFLGLRKNNSKMAKGGLLVFRIGAFVFAFYKLISFILGIVEYAGILKVLSLLSGLSSKIQVVRFVFIWLLIVAPLVGLAFALIFILQFCFGMPLSYKKDDDVIGTPFLSGILAVVAVFFAKLNLLSIGLSLVRNIAMFIVAIIYATCAWAYRKARGKDKRVKLTDAIKNVTSSIKEESGASKPVAATTASTSASIPTTRSSNDVKKAPVVNKVVTKPSVSKSVKYNQFESLVAPLFDEDFNKVDKRYKLLKEDVFSSNDAPITLTHFQILFDNLSEKYLLRLNAKNNSGVGVKDIEISIKLKDENDNPLGFIESLTLENDNEDKKKLNISSLGIVIPSHSNNGELFVNKITFSDSMTLDKSFRYVLGEKDEMEKDIQNFMKLHPVGGNK